MLQDLIGVRLTLLAGPGIPRPLPAPLMARLVSAEVAISDREVSGFELVFDAIRAARRKGLHDAAQRRLAHHRQHRKNQFHNHRPDPPGVD